MQYTKFCAKCQAFLELFLNEKGDILHPQSHPLSELYF